MRFLDLTLTTAAENLALDEAVLLEAESGRGGEVLRLWPSPVNGGPTMSPPETIRAPRAMAGRITVRA